MSKSEDEIRQHARMEWNAAAPGWKKYGKDLLKWMAPVSDQLIKSTGITSGQTVLDVVVTGIGQPALTIAKKILGQNGKVVGVDLSQEMLEVAKDKLLIKASQMQSFKLLKTKASRCFLITHLIQ